MEGSSDTLRLEVPSSAAGSRLDRYLADALGDGPEKVSRATLQAWIKEGFVLLNGETTKPRQAVACGDQVTIATPRPRIEEILPEPMDLSILFEDEEMIVVDKAPGMVVHPGSGNANGTLVNALLHHCEGRLCALAGEDRPGIVHRLDKDTSGCLVVAKSESAYHSLVAQFSGRETGKEYIAISHGIPVDTAGTISNRIGRNPHNRQKMAVVEPPAGKEAITDYRVVKSDENAGWARLVCVIHTGRTHQIRVHLKESLRCPILGDVIYGQPSRQNVKTTRLMLHAHRLKLRHPGSGEELSFEAPVPKPFEPFL